MDAQTVTAPSTRLAAPPGSTLEPGELAPLRALSFFALAWVVLNQFRDHLGLHAGTSFGVVGKGYLGASLFFVLTGFTTCSEYVRLRADGRFNYPSFLWRRLITFYPLHLVTLVAMGVLFVIGGAMAVTLKQAAFNPADLPANLLLVHAWGVLPTVSWNFPSWLVSALWFALLTFPVTAWLALKFLRPTAVAVAAPLLLFVVGYEVASSRGVLFTDMTAQIGALQTIPAFLYGAGLYRLGRERSLPVKWSATASIAVTLWIIVAASLRLSDLAIWPAFGVLVFCLAGTSDSAKPLLGSKLFQSLGAISMAIYLIYLPVDIIYFHAIQRLFGTPTGYAAWLAWWGVFPVILLIGFLAFYLIQRPTTVWLRRRDPFTERGRPLM